jgi:O-Antigen ligase
VNSTFPHSRIFPAANTAVMESLSDVRRTRWMFAGLCFYLLSQGFTIPVLAVGPSWAIWPTLSDIGIGLLVLAVMFTGRISTKPSQPNQSLFLLLRVLLLGFVLAYLGTTLWLDSLGLNNLNIGSGETYGFFQVFRLGQFFFVFWATIRTPLPPSRVRILNRITGFVLIFVCVTVLLTYHSVIPTTTFGGHLPADPTISGPWSATYLRNFDEEGLGTIGYNHAYVAIQVLMLLGLKLHLSSKQRNLLPDNLFILVVLLASFVSGSRAGFASVIIFSLIIWVRRPFPTLFLGSIILFVIVIKPDVLQIEGISTTLERQSTILQVTDADNLSGRTEIWQAHLDYLSQNASRWLIGSGPGSTMARDQSNGHMLALQIVLETGIIGLLGFCILFIKILKYLWHYETDLKPIFWTTVVLLISSVSQETFYPVPAMGHFIGFYSVCVGVVLRTRFPADAPALES